MKKTICVLTATRAEYGLLKTIIQKLDKVDDVIVKVAVTGMHLSSEFGLTYQEIECDGIAIDKKIAILLSADTAVSISKSMALAMISFAEYFEESKPDLLIVLGDRYETLAVCCAAMNAMIPIVHLYGGETTEGAIDESIRHSITKMSYLHLTSTDAYRKRVIQLGENPKRVYTVGAMGIENILQTSLLSKTELEKSIGFCLDKPYAVVTFHPVTLEYLEAGNQFQQVLLAIDEFKNMQFVFTKANADANGRVINKMIDDYVEKHENTVVFASLGMLRYLSAVKYADMVIGNSSSGLVEVPTFGIPTINIGDRQKGRLQAKSVIDCSTVSKNIKQAMHLALSEAFKQSIANCENPYGNGQTSDKIVNTICDFLFSNPIDLKKKFYDVDFEVEV
jgi:GDP/UDP-N,N'-diacetylbacillosamine 2-epimerase (hydrolysing)